MVELLVAIALFAVLMSGVVMLFVGSVRSARTSYQQIDAFEKARSALNIVQNDLVTGFSSHQSSDLHTFYGTPIGMTFIGLVPSSSGSGDFTVARITYVVYNRVVNKGTLISDVNADVYNYRFPGALENDIAGYDKNGAPVKFTDLTDGEMRPLDAYPYPLLRFVEPDTSDLNTFPIPWDESIAVGSMAKTYRQVLDELCGCVSDAKLLTDPERERIWAAKCEMWIRMLAGGDTEVPINYWDSYKWNLSKRIMDPLDYMVADNILSEFPPNRTTATYPPGPDRQSDPNLNRQDASFCATTFFDYDLAAFYENAAYLDGSSGEKIANSWWNDIRSSRMDLDNSGVAPYVWQCGDPGPETCAWNIRLPQIVEMRFWLMFESPYPGAPDFQRHFSLQINIPAAYERPQE